jgi:threonine dehydratase
MMYSMRDKLFASSTRHYTGGMTDLIALDEIVAAQGRLRGVAVRTGLYRVPVERLSASGIAELPFELYVKAESEQPIGSFKLRGAYNRIAQLTPEQLGRGVITYSSGNHAQGVAYAARALGAKAVIVMPGNAPAVKIDATRALGAEVVLVGPSSSERMAKAVELAAVHGYTVVPPYDDPAIIAGQGTCGLEILEQLGASKEEVVIVSPVSGGGLLAGVSTAVKLACAAHPADSAAGGVCGVQVWGAEPELAADAKESFETKTLVEWPAAMTTRTISDGLRTQSLGRLNFEHIVRFVDGICAVSEEEILTAMRVMLAATGLVAEPSGAVTLAAALFHHAEMPRCSRMVVILSGGNVDPELRNNIGQIGLGRQYNSR